MWNGSSSIPVLVNSIFWGNEPPALHNNDPSVDTPFVSFCDVQGGLPPGAIDGGGNIDPDPLFVRDPDDGGDGFGDDPNTSMIDEGANDDFGDLRLQAGSPAIDAGLFTILGPRDLDGNPRFVDDLLTPDTGTGCICFPPSCQFCGPFLDLGAYEYQIVCPCDIDGSQTVTLTDYAALADCLAGPNVSPDPPQPLTAQACLDAFDFDADEDVDLFDARLFATVIEGS